MDYYKTKYRFQWWWYSHGGKEAFETAVGSVCVFLFIYMMWFIAYLMDPPGM